MSEELLRRGAQLDRYEIRELIGQGGMGEVYRAWDMVIQRDVAMKVLRLRDEDMQKRFEREAEAIGKVDSENVVEIHDFRLHGEHPYIVMELLRGTSLRERLSKSGAMSIEDAVGVALGVCRGVGACHRLGIIHRDLKPANVFLTETAHYGTVVKVLDFGVAKPRRYTTDVTEHGKLVGTPAYTAPEVLNGMEADELSDQYGIGLLLYVALTGKPPFGKKANKELRLAILRSEFVPLGEARPDLPEGLVAIVLRALNGERAARFPSVMALGRALIPYASEEEKEISGEVLREVDDVEGGGNDAPTAVGKAAPQPDGSATEVVSRRQIADLARRSAALSEPAAERPGDVDSDPTTPAGAKNGGHVVVPVAPMVEAGGRGWSPIPHLQSSTKVDSSLVFARRDPTCTHVAGVMESRKGAAGRAGRTSRRRAVGVAVVLGLVLMVGAVAAVLVTRMSKRPAIRVPTVSEPAVAEGEADGGLPVASPMPDSSTWALPAEGAVNREGPGDKIAPSAVRTNPPDTVGTGETGSRRRPSHAKGHRRIEYTKDGSPILW